MAKKSTKRPNMKLSVALAASWHNIEIEQVLGPANG
jgi:hypothetical protein